MPAYAAVTEREAREAFHTLVLWHLRERVPTADWRLKGGVNLRLFFGSVRYSEDMDLDPEPRARLALRSAIQEFLGDLKLRRRLAALGIRDVLRTSERPAKDTETTLRFKMRLEIGCHVAYKCRSGSQLVRRTAQALGPFQDEANQPCAADLIGSKAPVALRLKVQFT